MGTTFPVVPGQCPQLAPASSCVPWTCHPGRFTPWENTLQDTWIHWFGANRRDPKRLCLPLVSHCEFLEIVIPGKKTSISKLRGYFLCHIRDLPFFLTLQTIVFKRMT